MCLTAITFFFLLFWLAFVIPLFVNCFLDLLMSLQALLALIDTFCVNIKVIKTGPANEPVQLWVQGLKGGPGVRPRFNR